MTQRVADGDGDRTLRWVHSLPLLQPEPEPLAHGTGALLAQPQVRSRSDDALLFGFVLDGYSSKIRSIASCAIGAVGSASWK